jgi:hypothetical protein
MSFSFDHSRGVLRFFVTITPRGIRPSRLHHLMLGIITVIPVSCSPDGAAPTKPETDTGFLVPGKGVRVLLEATSDADNLDGSLSSTALSVQDDGAVSWTYGQSVCCGGPPKLYREKFDGQTGQLLTPDGDLKKITRTDLYTGGPDGFGASIWYVQGTGKLYQSTKNAVTGDVPNYVNLDSNTFTGPPIVYPDGDVVISSNPAPIGITSFSYNSQMWVRRKHGTQAEIFQTQNVTGDDPDAFWHGGICYPSDANGAISCLTATASKVLVIDVQGSGLHAPKIVGSTPFPGVRIVNAVNISPTYQVKTSADHAKSVVMLRDSISAEEGYMVDGKRYQGYLYSTFVVDNRTHQVNVVVSSQLLKDLYDFRGSDFDLDGNFYYFKWPTGQSSDRVEVIKQTATGPTVLKGGFLVAPTTPYTLSVSASGKVYAVLANKAHFAVCGLN